MKITKLVHSCLLVEMPEPVNRTVLFDPGIMSEEAVNVDSLMFLDNIVVTHSHSDHCSVRLIRQLVDKFPKARITTTTEVADMLQKEGIDALSEDTPGIELFDSPHERLEPVGRTPEQVGVHYLDTLTHPGDSHIFTETKAILALPVTAPWGSMVRAAALALELKPKYILPIHDWHWNDKARTQAYDNLEKFFSEHDITFLKLQTGEPVVLDI